MSEIGELVLLIGDFHVPVRSPDLPFCFQELLNTDKIRTVLCTGNLGSSSLLERMQSLGQAVHVVRGDFDEDKAFASLPETIVTNIGKFKVGIINGQSISPLGDKTALAWAMHKLDVDILVSGGTHKFGITDLGNKWLIDPGSATGAYSGDLALAKEKAVPSFMLMAVQGAQAVVYIYEERDGKPNVVMSEFCKTS